MDPLKAPIVATLLCCMCFVRAHCDAASTYPSPEQEQEIQMLRSKVASLEDDISRRKEDTSQLESVVRERTAQMAALVAELELLQKVNVDDESVMKATTHNGMLEKQIERLANDLEDQIRKGESLEARAIEAERSLHEFGRKLEHAEKIHIEQRNKIQDLSDRLQDAQDKLCLLENEAKSKAEELAKIHGMWLPHWLAVRVLRCQELASAKWQVHGKAVYDPLMLKVAEKSMYAQGLVEPRLQKAKNLPDLQYILCLLKKLVPVALDALRNTTTAVLRSAVANSTTAAYRVCKDVIQACTLKAGEFADNYWQAQESKRFSQPYVSAIISASEPHVSRAILALKPNMRPVTSAWRRLVSFTSEYHGQVQDGVKRFALEGNQLLTPVAADRLAWFTASALLALPPALSVYKVVSAAVRRRTQPRRGRALGKGADQTADLPVPAASRNAESTDRDVATASKEVVALVKADDAQQEKLPPPVAPPPWLADAGSSCSSVTTTDTRT